jgi:hypothetical protein
MLQLGLHGHSCAELVMHNVIFSLTSRVKQTTNSSIEGFVYFRTQLCSPSD